MSSPIFLRDSRASKMRARMKSPHTRKARRGRCVPTTSRFSHAGWFSCPLMFRLLYYSWGKMGTTCSLWFQNLEFLFSFLFSLNFVFESLMCSRSYIHVEMALIPSTLGSLLNDGNKNSKKVIGLDNQLKQQLCTCIRLFCTLLCSHCMTAT